MPTSDPIEFHVCWTDSPDSRWEVHFDDKKMGYPSWDKRVATSAAKELAKASLPSKVVIHDRQGDVQKEILYEPKN